VHERIPMPTPDGQRTLQRENLTAEERFFDTLHGMYAGEIEGHKALIATAERRIAKAQVEMAKVAEALLPCASFVNAANGRREWQMWSASPVSSGSVRSQMPPARCRD
jgi:hypothetical protein